VRLERIVFVPQTPLLIPAVATGAAHELDDVRGAIAACLREIADERVVVVAGTDATCALGANAPLSLRGFGLTDDALGGEGLPASLSIGAWLCRSNGIEPVGFVGVDGVADDDGQRDEARELIEALDPTSLIVVGDGSARRSAAAPGAFDQRASELDMMMEKAIAAVDVDAILDLEKDLCDELLVAGRAAWQMAARLVHSDTGMRRGQVEMFDPYGVAYFVGSWTRQS
jgi:hypothetical protein